jgi:hypothetical protein
MEGFFPTRLFQLIKKQGKAKVGEIVEVNMICHLIWRERKMIWKERVVHEKRLVLV